ncbi:MAG: histidine kinase, partial [bacterium]|nr:histidine kinase [bacterium]
RRYSYKEGDLSGISDNFICTIYPDRSGKLWISTERGGLNRFDSTTGQFTRYSHDPDNSNSLSHQYTQGILEDKEGNLWVGTLGGGLNRLDRERKSFIHYTEKDGLADNVVYGILEAENGNLWLSTDRGISRLNPKTGEFRNYDLSYGLQGDMFSFGAYYKNSSGEMFFGGVQGVNSFFPNEIRDNPYRPPVVITDFQLINRSVSVGQEHNDRIILKNDITQTRTITLRRDTDNVISFQFAALNYIFPE